MPTSGYQRISFAGLVRVPKAWVICGRTKDVSSPAAKNFLLFFRGKSAAFDVRPVPREGRWPSSRTLERDAVDAKASSRAFLRADERRYRVRRSRVVLTPRCWRQVGDDAWHIIGITLAMVTKKPGRQGEHEGSRKPLRRECRLRPVNLWHYPGIFCPNHGCIGHPAFLAPSFFEGRAEKLANLGRSAFARTRRCVWRILRDGADAPPQDEVLHPRPSW
jgi:hypothetical protein